MPDKAPEARMSHPERTSIGSRRFFHPARAAGCRPAVVLFAGFLLVVGLWPFNFRATNRARVLADGTGLQFDAPDAPSKRNRGGMVFTPNSLLCRQQGGCSAGALTIAIELSAGGGAGPCVKRIVDFRRGDGGEGFYVGQWKSTLIVRSFGAAPAKGRPYREIGVGGVLTAGQTRRVSVVSGDHGTRIYVDGLLAREDPGVRLLGANESLDGYKAYLGNSPDLSCPWAGRVRRLALFDTAWDATGAPGDPGREPDGLFRCGGDGVFVAACYRFTDVSGGPIPDRSVSGNNLWRPPHLVFEKPFLALSRHRPLSATDIALNLGGFVPLGFLICLCLQKADRRPAWIGLAWALGVGCLLSLTIELTQLWLPGRESSLLDLAMNTAGSVIGGMALLCCNGARRGRAGIASPG